MNIALLLTLSVASAGEFGQVGAPAMGPDLGLGPRPGPRARGPRPRGLSANRFDQDDRNLAPPSA